MDLFPDSSPSMPPTTKKYPINNFHSVNTNSCVANQTWSTVVDSLEVKKRADFRRNDCGGDQNMGP